MKPFYAILFFMTLGSLPLFSQTPPSTIHFSLADDTRLWKIASKESKNDIDVVEYMLDSETPDNRTELVTLHYIHNLSIPPTQYYEQFLSLIKKNFPKSQVGSNIIKQDDRSIFGEWWIQDKSPNDQHELIKIFNDGKNMAIIRYTTKKGEDSETTRKKWENILSSATYP